jgi:DNA transformation protein and related proteins
MAMSSLSEGRGGHPTKGGEQEDSMVYRPLRYEQMMRAAEAHDVKARRMFGGMGIYTGEKMFAFLVGEEVGFKLGPDDLSAAMSIPGAGPLRPAKDAEPMREYVKMPREILDNVEQFMFWMDRSLGYAQRKMALAA